MQAFASIVIRALLIATVFASVGALVNQAVDDPVPWVYAPPKDVVLAGVTVQLIDEKQAANSSLRRRLKL